MASEMEKPRITEIKVRIDCNGCANKIKKALHGITGIYDIYVDFSQQKVTVIGWADPQTLVKAIKKTRKSAIICSHTEQSDESAEPTPETGAPNEGAPPPPESADPPAEPAEAPNEPPNAENHPPKEKPSLESSNDGTTNQPAQPHMPRDREEVRVIYHHSPDYGHRYPYDPHFQQGYNGQWVGPHGDPGFRGEPFQPPRSIYVTHSYNTYKPAPYVTEYAYLHSPLIYSHYSEQWNGLHGDPRFRGEPFQPPRPVYPTHNYDVYKSSPYVTEYAYPRSPPRHSHCSGQPNGHPRSPPRHSHCSGQPNGQHGDPGIQGEPFQPPQPVYATQSYNTYKPSPYVTEYAYPRSPPRYSQYSRPGHYREDYYYSGNNGNGNITSMFSDENPNACRII